MERGEKAAAHRLRSVAAAGVAGAGREIGGGSMAIPSPRESREGGGDRVEREGNAPGQAGSGVTGRG